MPIDFDEFFAELNEIAFGKDSIFKDTELPEKPPSTLLPKAVQRPKHFSDPAVRKLRIRKEAA